MKDLAILVWMLLMETIQEIYGFLEQQEISPTLVENKKEWDNILYGLRDRDFFPYFRHSSNGIIPSPITVDVATDEVSMNSEFISKALYVAQNAPHVDNISVCAKSRDDGGSCAATKRRMGIST